MSKTKKPKADIRYFVKHGREVVKKHVYGECEYFGEKRLYTRPNQSIPAWHNTEPAKLFFKTPEAAIKALNKVLGRQVEKVYKRYEEISAERDKLVEKAIEKFNVDLYLI